MCQELRDLFIDLTFRNTDPINNYLNLFHYTSNDSKEKILQEDYIDFRLSRADDFLDKNEGLQILEPFKCAYGMLYEEKEINKDFYKIMREIEPDKIREYNKGTWILSFTPNGNSQYMKNRYAPGDGWIIGVQALYFDDMFEDINKHFPALFDRIELPKIGYSQNKMCKKFNQELKKVFNCYQECIRNLRSHSKEHINNCLIRLMSDYIALNSYNFKSMSYKKEEEIRFICRPKVPFSSYQSQDGNIQMKYVLSGSECPNLHLRLNKERYLYCYTDKLEWQNKTELNKAILSLKPSR